MTLDATIPTTLVKGMDKGDLLLFALSTCPWCNKMKRFLNGLGVEYRYVDVDLLDGKVRKLAEKEVRRCNPRESYPTIVIDGEKCIIGNMEDDIRKALGL